MESENEHFYCIGKKPFFIFSLNKYLSTDWNGKAIIFHFKKHFCLPLLKSHATHDKKSHSMAPKIFPFFPFGFAEKPGRELLIKSFVLDAYVHKYHSIESVMEN